LECKYFQPSRSVTAKSSTTTKITVPETAIPIMAAVLSGLADVWSAGRKGACEVL